MDLTKLSIKELEELKQKRWNDNQEKIAAFAKLCFEIANFFKSNSFIYINHTLSEYISFKDYELWIKVRDDTFSIVYKNKIVINEKDELFNPGSWTDFFGQIFETFEKTKRDTLIFRLTLPEE